MAEPMAHRLGGRYEVRSLIGRGGMAEVHLGFDSRLSRTVAIKMLRTDLARDAVFQHRFRREAQSAASLNHPNIVAVYDTGEEDVYVADGSTVAVPFIVMEYVEGHTVKDLIADGTPVPIDEAIEIASGILAALDYSHANGLVHRDIKPGNVMLTQDGKVKVMDFGIARALTDSQATMTQTNAVVGTAQYLSPEQARGETVDARSDLYSTGVLLFELLTGRPPFRGDSAVAVAYQHVQQVPPTPSSIAGDVPEPLDRIVMKALAKNREDRYGSAGAMRDDLGRLAQGMQVNAPATAVWGAPALGMMDATQAMAPPPPPAPPANPVAGSAGAATHIAPVGPVSPPHGTQLAPAEEPKKNHTGIIVGVVLLAVILAVAAFLFFFPGAGGAQSVAVNVPDVTGKPLAEAKKELEAAGLVFVQGDPVPSEDIPVDSVVNTDPQAGNSVAEGSSVTVHLSSGPASVVIPNDLQGKTPEEAKAAVEGLGLVWAVAPDQVASDEIEAGKVASTNPSGGNKVQAGSTVTGYISSGSNKVNVPDVTGMNQEQARKALEEAGLKVGNVHQANDPSQGAGHVVHTAPGVDQEARKGDSVEITLASGMVDVPGDLKGRKWEEVQKTLSDLTLSITLREQQSSEPAGTVLSVSVENQTVSQGAPVTVTVSTGPPPNTQQQSGGNNNNRPAPNPTPTPSPNPPQSARPNP
ncbi:MAG: Stk1 family PASTA domain-containing Ser/Thr kinase [Actinomycetaceae bacterium]|nr:Stk1 family PASTA domain-containing Ser/Thr kinase [Actinomycetaceae bacterium]